MTLAPESITARAIVGGCVALLFAGFVQATAFPTASAALRVWELRRNIAAVQAELAGYAQRTPPHYDLSTHMTVSEDVDSFGESIRTALQDGLRRNQLHVVRIDRQPDDETVGIPHRIVWHVVEARADVLSLSRFLDLLAAPGSGYVVRRFEVLDSGDGPAGTGLHMIAEIGQFWMPVSDAPPVETEEATIALPGRVAGAHGVWINASPFSPEHGPFRRPAPPQPPPPPVEVSLLGITRRGDTMMAALRIGGNEMVAELGSATEAGEIIEIGADYVVLDSETRRRYSLFERN